MAEQKPISNVNNHTISAKSREYIKTSHELHTKPVKFDESYNLIGYGHFTPVVENLDALPPGQADLFFKTDIANAEMTVNNLVKREINQPQFDALVGVAYDMPPNGFLNSKLLEKVNNEASTKEIKDEIKALKGYQVNSEKAATRRKHDAMLWSQVRDRWITAGVLLFIIIVLAIIFSQRKTKK